jgi:hypothetical protein
MSRALLTCVALGVCAFAGTAAAEEFSWDLFTLFSRTEVDSVFETDRVGAQATYHVDPVDDANGPYALAAFLDPATRVSIGLSHEERRAQALGAFAGPELVTQTDDWSVGGRYLLRPSQWYFGGSYTTGDIDPPPLLGPADSDSSGYGVIVGKYLGAATTLEAAYERSKVSGESEFTVCSLTMLCQSLGTQTQEERREHASVRFLHVRTARSLTYSLLARIAASSGEITIATPFFTLPINLPRLKSYSVGGELFPTARLGVRLGYTRWDDATPADEAYDVAATWFITRRVGLELVLSRQTSDESYLPPGIAASDHADAAALRVIGRF